MKFRIIEFQRGILNRDFPKSKILCQQMDGVWSCFNLIYLYCNVISDILRVKRPGLSQTLHTFRNAIVKIIISIIPLD